MIMFYVYVLKSDKDKKLYIGYSSDLKSRLLEHQRGRVRSTKARLPIKLIYYESFLSETDARKREIKLKNQGGSMRHLKDRLNNSLL